MCDSGTADLSADVHFSYLFKRRNFKRIRCIFLCFITQKDFLQIRTELKIKRKSQHIKRMAIIHKMLQTESVRAKLAVTVSTKLRRHVLIKVLPSRKASAVGIDAGSGQRKTRKKSRFTNQRASAIRWKMERDYTWTIHTEVKLKNKVINPQCVTRKKQPRSGYPLRFGHRTIWDRTTIIPANIACTLNQYQSIQQ
ncbi:hypothetical protein BD770DRAFT_430989 [Pilaira anomala]|nr:hypothetical protein BD770DRAFT_430989 [Pilaira anomala]